MLKSMKKDKKYIWWMVTVGLFGISGLLLVPVVKYITKVANHHPKAFRWISIFIFTFICVHVFIFTQNWNSKIAIICIVVAIAINNMNINSKQ